MGEDAASFQNGSSPRLRGTPFGRRGGVISKRFIPAPAGNAQPVRVHDLQVPVHPRACGERAITVYKPGCTSGSSPRLRGTREIVGNVVAVARFIPAPAGNACWLPSPFRRRSVHPRACGERRPKRSSEVTNTGSSPRLRGTLPPYLFSAAFERFIPAPAGNASHSSSVVWPRTVHPRACGERISDKHVFTILSGSSPRLRGTLLTPA